jgi:hypothetical protein
MAANKILSFQPAYVPAAAANLLNCNVTSLAGPTGYTQTQPYLLVKHIKLLNKDTAARLVTLYKGATGASVGGTEFAFDNVSIPAQGSVEWFGQARFDAADFLTGVADAASKVTINIDGEIGVA